MMASSTNKEQVATTTAVQPTNKGVTIVDPDGKQVELNYQWMRLHPCEIIAENPTSYSDDPTAVKISRTFRDSSKGTLKASVRASTARVEATDLFDPELLCIIPLPAEFTR